MIGVLGDQNLGDQRLGRDPAFDNPRRGRGLHDGALAGAATIARAARDQHAEGGRYHIEPFGDVFPDLVECAAATGTGLILDINDLLDPLEMRG
jgi:hypothetical protein